MCLWIYRVMVQQSLICFSGVELTNGWRSPTSKITLIIQSVVIHAFPVRIWSVHAKRLRHCIAKEQLRFICESNMINEQDICLDTEQSICHFEVHAANQTTILVYIGQVCVCLRTVCPTIVIDNSTMNNNHFNLCICNFIKMDQCDFSYQALVLSYQYVKINFTTV